MARSMNRRAAPGDVGPRHVQSERNGGGTREEPPKRQRVETVPTGSRVWSDVGASARFPALFVVRGPQQGAVFPLGPTQTLGRDESADVQLHDGAISRVHASIVVREGVVLIEDRGSRNGTAVDAVPLGREAVPLQDGSYVAFGPVTLVKFRMVDRLELDALQELHDSTLRDPLTRLYNRRYFDERIETEFSYARRQGVSLAVLVVDIDHFKRVNDSLGHLAGDHVLRLVAGAVHRIMRPEDVVARYGGEEFVVIARNTTVEQAVILAERIRERVAELTTEWEGHTVRVTASVGLAVLEPGHPSVEAMIEAADEALYEAKRAGRNCVRAAKGARA